MSAFDDALKALHSDQNLSRVATYRVGGAGAGLALRVIWGEPTKDEPFGETGAIVKEIRVDVRLADVASPKKDDTIDLGAKRYSVLTVIKDTEGLTATLTLKYKEAVAP